MTMSLEDRLRAHYAERTEREPLPGPDGDEALAEILQPPQRRVGRTLPIRPLAIAAALLVVCAAAGLFVVNYEKHSGVSTVPDGSPDGVTTVPSPAPSTIPPTTVTPDTTAPPAPSPSTTPAVIVARWGQIGWWDGTKWVGVDSGLAVPAAGGEEYQLVRLDDPITTGVGGWGDGCVPSGEPQGRSVHVAFPETDEAPAVAVTGIANPRPRPVRVLDGGAAYRDAAVAVLAGLGITDPDPHIAQVVSSDLDGDGADEVFVAVDRVTGTDPWDSAPDDYSVVFLRRVVDGAVQTTVLEDERAWSQEPDFYLTTVEVSAVADLNGDGRMEVVVEGNYFEGAGVVVRELRNDGSLPEVLSGGCGA